MISVCLVRKRHWAVRLSAHAPCEGLCRLALPLLWDSVGSLSVYTVILSHVCLKPDVPPLPPASGDVAVQLHVVREVWHRLPAVCHSCASCCAATPPAGQTQAPTSQTNQNNYKTLQSKFPGRKRKSIWGNSHRCVWPDEEAKVASRKSAQMCQPPPSVEILKLRDISVRDSQLEPLFYLTELRAELTDSIQHSGMSYKHA